MKWMRWDGVVRGWLIDKWGNDIMHSSPGKLMLHTSDYKS